MTSTPRRALSRFPDWESRRRHQNRRVRLVLVVICLAVLAVPVAWVARGAAVAQHGPLVALTFDDGPTPGFTERVLEILRAERVTATFFVSGVHAEAYPELVQKIVADGHMIGNHTYSHRGFDRMPADQAYGELLGTQQIIEQITGRVPRFARSPRGVETPASRAAMDQLGLVGSIGWHYSPAQEGKDDWTCSGSEAALAFAQAATADGAILLAHDGNEVTKCPDQLAWLPAYIAWAKSAGYGFGLLGSGPSAATPAGLVLTGGSAVEVVPSATAARWR